jgi:hypothetical protein
LTQIEKSALKKYVNTKFQILLITVQISFVLGLILLYMLPLRGPASICHFIYKIWLVSEKITNTNKLNICI